MTEEPMNPVIFIILYIILLLLLLCCYFYKMYLSKHKSNINSTYQIEEPLLPTTDIV
ncbi:hypothetical protein crov234 [Cafeteria roenbergensis virus]|uniref:Uncharacterized protein n=1 Tax=Cafeteria roenbergensis virus (strain BV-PW1) TaxID=693272 RepID=E3T504_CROVB|nr:hypothetical protein crov234 [Cafeteria roenbergensis virus BV-PW1]ADO67267.1 hypothetical protein crov234 [Cafeteria roenbergensis virus BV-PW1]